MINLAALMQVFETEKTEDLKIKIKFVCKRGGTLDPKYWCSQKSNMLEILLIYLCKARIPESF